MSYDPWRHHRRSVRLRGYDYTQPGAYFITIVTQDRECLFGEVVDGEMRLNAAGQMIQSVWNELSLFYPCVATDAFVVMPNHIHGIIVLTNPVGAPSYGCPDVYPNIPASNYTNTGQTQGSAPTEPTSPQPDATRRLSLADVVHRFKTMTTKRYADGVKQFGWAPFPRRLWQRNYYEHIIRSKRSLNRLRTYIRNNPLQWASDPENPDVAQDPSGSTTRPQP